MYTSSWLSKPFSNSFSSPLRSVKMTTGLLVVSVFTTSSSSGNFMPISSALSL